MPNTRKILIVDDDPEMRDALTEQLSLHEEFETLAVENGSKGVQAAKAGLIDLVIMDVGLPDIDGREAMRILRKNGFKAPIIMLTPIPTPFSASNRAPTITSVSRSASPCCWRAFAPSFASMKPARTRSSSSARIRSGQAAGVAGDAAAGGLGLQCGTDDAHAGDPHLPATAEDRKRRRRPRDPGHRGRRLQTGAVIAMYEDRGDTSLN